jgi:hypothetical protein
VRAISKWEAVSSGCAFHFPFEVNYPRFYHVIYNLVMLRRDFGGGWIARKFLFSENTAQLYVHSTPVWTTYIYLEHVDVAANLFHLGLSLK